MRVIDIPGYLEAIQRERLVREVSLLNLNERIGCFEVMPMTLNHLVMLRLANSPLIPPMSIPDRGQMATFLWCLSPHYSADIRKRKAFLITVLKVIGPDDIFEEVLKAATEYVEETFQDRPARSEGGIPGPDYYSDAVSVVAAFGREFGWSMRDTMDLSLKVAFQLLKEIQERLYIQAGMNAPLGNPSDRIKSKWLEARNAALKKN